MMDTLLVFTNLPDRASADALARALIERRLAACVSVLAECTSTYRWEGAIESANEIPLLIKTTEAAYASLQEAIRELHPYELPEIIAVPLQTGLPQYLEWIRSETRP
jgi:periplasmic divalent cation tolerance protein